MSLWNEPFTPENPPQKVAYDPKERVSVAEAAELLGVSTETVRRMVVEGQLIAWRPNPRGRKYLLYKAQVMSLEQVERKKAHVLYEQLQLFL